MRPEAYYPPCIMYRHIGLISIMVFLLSASISMAQGSSGAWHSASDLATSRPETIRPATEILGPLPGLTRAFIVGNSPPAIVVALPADASALSGTRWLELINELANRQDPDASVLFLTLDEEDGPVFEDIEPGASPWKTGGVMRTLAELHVSLVLVMDMTEGASSLRLDSAAYRRLSPLDAVKAVRQAFAEADVPIAWLPVTSFFAKAGLTRGNDHLEPWLAAELPAVALGGDLRLSGESVSASEERLGAAVARLARLKPQDDKREDADVNYLVYPFPGKELTLDDRTLLFLALGFFAAICMSATIRFRAIEATESGNVRSAGVVRESLQSIVIALLASGAAAFAGRAAALIATVVNSENVSVGGSPGQILIFGTRIASFLAAYFAISGYAARAGLLRHTDRATALRASALAFTFLGVVAMVVLPQAAPYAFACALCTMLGTVAGPVSAAFLMLAVALPMPYFLPILAGRHPEIATALLYGSWVGALLQALLAAPFALWLGASLSGGSRLRRGGKPAFFFALGLPIAVLVEAAVLLLQ